MKCILAPRRVFEGSLGEFARFRSEAKATEDIEDVGIRVITGMSDVSNS